MLSENNLKRRNLQDSQVYKDYQDTSDNDALYRTIELALIGVTGYGLYKSGALKDIVQPLLELADDIAQKGTDKAADTMSTIKKWSNLKHLTQEELNVSKIQSVSPPQNSLFRERNSSIFYDLFKDIQDFSPSNNVNFTRVKNVINETIQDMNILKKMIQDSSENISLRRTDYSKTSLSYYLWELKNTKTTIDAHLGPQSAAFKEKAIGEWISFMSLSPEKAAQQMKESGYRNITLGDVVEKVVGKKGLEEFATKEGSEIDLNSMTNKEGMSLLYEFNKFFQDRSNRYRKNGKFTNIFASDDWKNIIIDPGMRINEKGHIIDYRMSKENYYGFLHSLANDFKLPLVKFNPFKVAGLDKVGRRKPFMGVLSPEQFAPDITKVGGMDESSKLGQWMADAFDESYANKGVLVVDGKAYTTDSNNQLLELADRLKLHDITKADTPYGIKPTLNAYRQISGLTTGEIQKLSLEKYEEALKEAGVDELTKFQKFKYEFTKLIDMGFQESRPKSDNAEILEFDDFTNIDVFINNLIQKATSKIRTNGFEYKDVEDMLKNIQTYNFKTLFGTGFKEFEINDRTFQPRMVTTTREGFKLSNAYNYYNNDQTDLAKYELEGFIKQFVAGRHIVDDSMDEFFTERSTRIWSVFNKLDEGLHSVSHLGGLSIDSKRSTPILVGNLIAKRALPVYLATKVPGVLNYLSEPFFGRGDETGNRDNISKVMMRNVVRPIDVGAHYAMDLVGATKVFKFLGEMIPGSDQINEIPGIYQLGLGQTGEEREDYIENGYDPIRKGRWWSSGNTPFTGGKIMYFRPNIYRRVQADVDFSDSKWGSRQEYYNNTWFPNPINPFAPLNHFIFDRNHYDKKHYHDRPYLQTAPEGQNIPIIGPTFSSTIGKIINPPKKMHKEYWQRGFQLNPADELPNPLLMEIPYNVSGKDIDAYINMQQKAAVSNEIYQNTLSSSSYQAKQVISKSYIEKAGITFEQRNILPVRTYDRYNTPYEVYSTPSGALNVVDVPDEMNLYNVNQDLQRWSINKVIGTNQRVTLVDNFQGPGIPVGNDNELVDNAFTYGIGEQYNWLGDIAGLKGFALQTFVTGEANTKARVIEDSGYAYSFNDSFWDMNLGGMGGNLSEISRRFIPKRNNSTEYVNPIRNTMPSWMPGSNYFTDFKHGDPYSKIENGEERLPGEGYERLHNIKGLMEFNIGSSSIGYEKDYIIRHMLSADKYMSSFEEDTLSKGDEIHKQIGQSWLDAGLAINLEGKVEDKRNGIIGWYDALVHDISSPTGVAIVDIKSTSAKKLEELRESGQPLTHHMRQTNFYLWATGNTQSKGYIHYVDKENPENTYTVGFNYSQEELDTTLNNVYEARQTIRKAVEKGEIGRGELYDTLDRFRILADVAPYSQEFKDVSAQLASEDLSAEEQEEASQIRERVKQQKEPLRVYPYKFKTANLKSETVTVSKIIDNNTIVTKEYGKQHSIKFAGINVSMSNSEMYDKKQTKNEAARQTIKKYIKPGSKIRISYDADERNKYSKDSTRSIRAVVHSKGKNVNRLLLNKGHAKEKDDDSPAGIRARYSNGEIAFGSAMESVTHGIGKLPFIGSKFLQVRSPYEQYRKREVYGKDFQSWNHPIRDMLIPSIQENIADSSVGGLGGIVVGAFIGSLFGKKSFGKIVGAVVGGAIPAIAKIAQPIVLSSGDKDRAWRPKRRQEQEKLNEYVDTLKYVKNMKLYNKYKIKAKKEDNFDVDTFIGSKEYKGVQNKLRQQELINYKRKVKLDFKHRDRYNFKYGRPKYVESAMDKKTTVSAINQELAELQGQRKVTKLPVNALKAIEFKQAADQTMYAYKPGDSLVNIMTALPKKERQYFKHFMDAPEEEKQKILRIAPSYLRRALQTTWGMPVDRKPSLNEYFQTHGLPDASWIGWDESTNIQDVKVKLVHQNKLDPGEFDIWEDGMRQADEVNIPIPMIDAENNPRQVQMKLKQILGQAGYNDVQMSFMQSSTGNKTSLYVKKDARDEVSQQINNLEF